MRGRSGRQGDVGESKFYIGLDDDLMKIFGGDTITKVYNTLGADENMPIESRILTRAVESAQKKVEGRNFSIRKNVLKYDDVMNVQREIIYRERRQVLDGENVSDSIKNMITSVADETVKMYIDNDKNSVNVESLDTEIKNTFAIEMLDYIKENEEEPEKISEQLQKLALDKYQEKEEEIGSEDLRELRKSCIIKSC